MASGTHYQTETVVLDKSSVLRAAELLKAGHLVAIPTETVYGLAADAFQPDAVAKIFSVKRRPAFDPLIVHVRAELDSLPALAAADLIDLSRMTKELRATAESLIREFWPGPLTIVLPKAKAVPDIVTSGLDQVAIRMPAHAGLQQLLSTSKLTLAAPSANLFGRVSPTQAAHVLCDFDGEIPLILDGGMCDFGIESTIVEIGDDGAITVLRRGSIAVEALGYVSVAPPQMIAPHAPGMLEKHYAPRVPLIIFDEKFTPAKLQGAKSVGIILPSSEEDPAPIIERLALGVEACEVRRLSAGGDSFEAARHLFALMREFEASKEAMVVVLPSGRGDGLWPAIQDRLQKAANYWA